MIKNLYSQSVGDCFCVILLEMFYKSLGNIRYSLTVDSQGQM